MSKLFTTYRVLAFAVGILLLVGTVSVFMTGSIESWTFYTVSKGSASYKIGHPLELVWVLHGWVFIIYVIVAFILTQRAKWSVPRFLVMMISGLIPVTIFFVEHFVAKRLRAQFPELEKA